MVKRVELGRLVYYDVGADARFWDEQWGVSDKESVYRAAEAGELGWLGCHLLKHLPREGKILEAGCGLGQYVVALRRCGYDVEGIDWAVETVKGFASKFPDLPVRQGDATRIDRDDGTYVGYISLGVIEHLREGPERFLTEAYRVLAPGGVALFTVPCFNPLRKLKGRLGYYRQPIGESRFYQYAFTREEIAQKLRNTGFRIWEVRSFDSYKGLKDEIGLPRFLHKGTLRGYDVGAVTQRMLYRILPLERLAGHMVLLICGKPR